MLGAHPREFCALETGANSHKMGLLRLGPCCNYFTHITSMSSVLSFPQSGKRSQAVDRVMHFYLHLAEDDLELQMSWCWERNSVPFTSRQERHY